MRRPQGWILTLDLLGRIRAGWRRRDGRVHLRLRSGWETSVFRPVSIAARRLYPAGSDASGWPWLLNPIPNWSRRPDRNAFVTIIRGLVKGHLPSVRPPVVRKRCQSLPETARPIAGQWTLASPQSHYPQQLESKANVAPVRLLTQSFQSRIAQHRFLFMPHSAPRVVDCGGPRNGRNRRPSLSSCARVRLRARLRSPRPVKEPPCLVRSAASGCPSPSPWPSP